jgi:hypothetical protein
MRFKGVSMKKIILLLLSFLLIAAAVAQAECLYNGQTYPPGTTINGKTCQGDGSWR